MQPESAKWLEDVRQACANIADFTLGKTFLDYEHSTLLRSAVERQFEVIGEALKRLERADPESIRQIGQYRRAIAFRNVLAHGYDVVDAAVAWDVVQHDLPLLHRDVQALLAQTDVDDALR